VRDLPAPWADAPADARQMLSQALWERWEANGVPTNTFGTSEPFGALVRQEIPKTKFLSPASSPRTLGAVARRIVDTFGTSEPFGALVRAPSRSDLDPTWFEPCARIEREGFDWSKWVRPWLIPAVEDERRRSPSTTLYVYEGVHSTIALAVALLNESVGWRPLETVVSSRRPPW
jgi:hypothetical protein